MFKTWPSCVCAETDNDYIFPMKEHQLLKDRKRSVRKRPSQRDNYSPTAPTPIPNQSRTSGQDTCTVKLVLVDSQNIQKLGPAKGSLKRNVNIGINRSNNKADSATLKPRQRRKPGNLFFFVCLF